MSRHKDPEKLAVHLTECTLATVEHLAHLKTKGKHEFERQIRIAQTGVDYFMEFKVKCDLAPRLGEVVETYQGNVSKWVDTMTN